MARSKATVRNHRDYYSALHEFQLYCSREDWPSGDESKHRILRLAKRQATTIGWKTNMLSRIGFIAVALLSSHIFNTTVYAVSSRIEPFVGSFQESWESFPNFRSTLETLGHKSFLTGQVSVLNGLATISHPKMGIYEPDNANYYLGSSGPAQTAHGQKGVGLEVTGPQILPEYIEPASITFVTPISAFGGYWGAGTDYLYDPEVIEFQFFDTAGNLVGADAWPYTRSFLIDESQMVYWGDGKLQWSGWQFDVPVQRVVFGGGAIVADYLQASPIPEPSSLVVIYLAIGISAGFIHRPARRISCRCFEAAS